LKIGFLTIGQSPRPEILTDLPESLGFLEVVEAGALDDLSAKDIESLGPKGNETVYVSTTRDGSQVLIAEERLVPLLQEKVKLLRNQGAETIVLLCSGEFDLGAHGILLPSRILRNSVDSVLNRKGRLGILIPEEAQFRQAEKYWSEFAEEVKVSSFSPYVDSIEVLQTSSKALVETDLIVMDCMGYSREHKKVTRQVTRRPVIAARTVTFHFLEELIL